MVAAEAAAAGSPPLVARHSGLAEVAAGLEEGYPERLRHLASFATGEVADLRGKLNEILALSPSEHDALRRAARQAVVDRWSHPTVADSSSAAAVTPLTNTPFSRRRHNPGLVSIAVHSYACTRRSIGAASGC